MKRLSRICLGVLASWSFAFSAGAEQASVAIARYCSETFKDNIKAVSFENRESFAIAWAARSICADSQKSQSLSLDSAATAVVEAIPISATNGLKAAATSNKSMCEWIASHSAEAAKATTIVETPVIEIGAQAERCLASAARSDQVINTFQASVGMLTLGIDVNRGNNRQVEFSVIPLSGTKCFLASESGKSSPLEASRLVRTRQDAIINCKVDPQMVGEDRYYPPSRVLLNVNSVEPIEINIPSDTDFGPISQKEATMRLAAIEANLEKIKSEAESALAVKDRQIAGAKFAEWVESDKPPGSFQQRPAIRHIDNTDRQPGEVDAERASICPGGHFASGFENVLQYAGGRSGYNFLRGVCIPN
jgi:hypothetical protein